jgi:hypothetical protein
MMMMMWQVNSHNPRSGQFPLPPNTCIASMNTGPQIKASTNITRQDKRHNHWPGRNPTKRRYRAFRARCNANREVSVKRCRVVRRQSVFRYHTKDTYFGPSAVLIAEASNKI